MSVKWSLKPLFAKGFKWTGIVSVLGIVVGSILEGVSKNMKLTLWGLFLCAIWVACTVAPLVTNLTARLLNLKLFGFLERRNNPCFTITGKGIRQARLESARRWFRVGIWSIVFCTFAGFTFSAFDVAVYYTIQKYLSDQLDEAHRGLRIIPLNRDFNGTQGWAVIENDSGVDIVLTKVICNAHSLTTHDGIKDHDIELNVPIFLPIMSGGDRQSLPCMPQGIVVDVSPNDYLVCADMTWKINYFLSTQPSITQEKAQRFFLLPWTREWKPVALSYSDSLNCDHETSLSR
jgi:hypothetical protein